MHKRRWLGLPGLCPSHILVQHALLMKINDSDTMIMMDDTNGMIMRKFAFFLLARALWMPFIFGHVLGFCGLLLLVHNVIIFPANFVIVDTLVSLR